MKLMYPSVVYFDKESALHIIVIPDANIVTEGETVEIAMLRAKDILKSFCDCSLRFNDEIIPATSFTAFKNKHPKDTVLLIDIELKTTEDKPKRKT